MYIMSVPKPWRHYSVGMTKRKLVKYARIVLLKRMITEPPFIWAKSLTIILFSRMVCCFYTNILIIARMILL